jgi:hypothetical protein
MKLNPQDLHNVAELTLEHYNQRAEDFWEGPMRVIALIEDAEVIRRILEHLGLWVPQVKDRGPPLDFASWPPYPSLPLTYHPVPDIA